VIEIQFNRPDYLLLLQQLATSLKTNCKDNCLTVPDAYGRGWAWAERLANGMTVLAMDGELNKQLNLHRLANVEQYFSLQFNEVLSERPDLLPSKINRNGKQVVMLQNYVVLSHSLSPCIDVVPAGVRVRSLRFFFNKQQLLQLLDANTVDKLVTQYFAPAIVKEMPEIIDVEYRPLLDMLLEKQITQPLKQVYIQNRVLLLLEKFIEKKLIKKSVTTIKTRLGESEVERLMQAESLLVKDYTTAPPTISKLSRICAMSPTKLKNDFKSLYGVPIYEYYQKNRLAKAKSILLEGNYNIKEVGMMVGYSNLSHFAAAFKKEFGILPSELMARDSVLMYAM
jgi:AraC-like DNA-binding protein